MKGRWVIAGVSGCGKTTVGRALAERLGVPFLDADDFHPPGNIAKMSSGKPLEDADRMPWLDALGAELTRRESVVLACSALKRAYRDRLRGFAQPLRFVVLEVPCEELQERLRTRTHFMPPELLDSQLADLEIGDDVLVVNGLGPVTEVVRRVERGGG
ncbi:gluconokinase [Haloferula sp. A504]|uniref:gluconokinase n=1 Tax=Haloferula sp. A504 TaxID=3373601 RepID=UPI0031C95AA0|nr:gluconokinase [Verrucomicrobiaceae bacterium E54]